MSLVCRWAGGDAVLAALAQMPHLTHADLGVDGSPRVVEALLRIPSLEHVTVESAYPNLPDFSKRPCRWRTLMLSSWASVAALARLPLGGLERLIVRKRLEAGGSGRQLRDGLAVLQRLHAAGKLVLRGCSQQPRGWQLPPTEGLFMLLNQCEESSAAVLRLVLEAGQGIKALFMDRGVLEGLRNDLAPLLLLHPGRVTTLCMTLHAGEEDDAEWWGELLGRLPASITHLKVDVMDTDDDQVVECLLALVHGGVEGALRRQLTLTLLHGGDISDDLAQVLVDVSLAQPPGQSVGVEQQQQQEQQRFLTLVVARTEWGDDD